MTKKKSILTVSEDFSDLFSDGKLPDRSPKKKVSAAALNGNRITLEQAIATITRQMTISGNRPRTISDYNVYVKQFAESMLITYVDDITSDTLYEWLSNMNVSAQTKLTRLKCLKAFLSRCFDNGWVTIKFWGKVNIRVDTKVKEGATDREIRVLLSVLDLNDYVQLRDATAALLMYKTGIRINTLVHLENRHIDFENNLLQLDGGILKNHKDILLPFDDMLRRLLTVLVKQNSAIREEYKVSNEYVFITKQGRKVATGQSHNNIQKRLNKYAKEFGLKNINPHALRRGFAKSLLNKGANITDISRALGHSNLAVTTQYLHIDKEEVADNLRKYL
ncbi:site-specific integrase [Rossellomorea vietnamensis]|uniref:tyrosine-type recombinase/integrase n=1 Tax=Rossellomorea vietnamensis TaxID=218284 RepID=UPI003D2D6717